MLKPPFSHTPSLRRPQGFSLIEFLIASMLSMIVLMAVTSSYFFAQRLNHSASGRLSVQQDVRSAANLIVRDARMAGSFGCFNLTGADPANIKSDPDSELSGVKLAATGQTNRIPIKILAAADFSPSNFTTSSDVLVFQYGIESGTLDSPGDDIEGGAPNVVSSCSTLARQLDTELTPANIRSALGITGTTSDGEIAVMRYTVHAYAVGTAGEQTGLFRFELDDDGEWGNPQLLVKNVQSWDLAYIHVTGCPETGSTDGTEERFVRSNSVNGTGTPTTPALIQITLNGNNIDASEDNNVYVYNIEANVRGGNTCADRVI